MGEGHGGETRLDQGDSGPELPNCLRGDSADEILDKLAEGDPLGLERRVLKHLDREGLVLPPSRLIQLAGAQIAYEALGYSGEVPLATWIEGSIRKAAAMLIDQQWSDERHGLPVIQCEDASYYRVFAELIGVEIELSRAMCCTINTLPDEARRVFHAVAIQGRTPASLAKEGCGAGQVARVNDLLRAATREVLLVLQAARGGEEGQQDER